MSRRWIAWLLCAVRMAWFRRARSLLWAWVLACSFVLCMTTPARADDRRPNEIRVCVRPPGVPAGLDRWAYSAGGKLLTERWAFKTWKSRDITIYVFDPNAPPISATYIPQRLFGRLQCPAKDAPSTIKPEAARKKKEAGERKKKEAEPPEASMRKAEPREGKEREAEKAEAQKEVEAAKQEQERRKKLALEEERHRLRDSDPCQRSV